MSSVRPRTVSAPLPRMISSVCRGVLACVIPLALPLTNAKGQQGGQGASRPTAGASEITRYAAASPDSEAPPRPPTARSSSNTGIEGARAVTAGNFVVFPFGHAQPVVTCTLLRVCIIELQDGEVVVNEPIAGDPVRWIVEAAKAGPEGRNALIVVKPKFCEITTNLVVPTDRRIYDLTLDSPPCKTRGGDPYNPQQPYARHVRFSYPDDTGSAALAAGEQGSRALGRRISSRDTGAGEVNRAYRLVRKRRGPFGLFGYQPLDFPWRPAAIYDDGAHLYLELPPAARHQAAPVLYAVEADGSRTLLNYTVQQTATGDGLYVTDRVVPRAALVLRSGAVEQRLVIENRAFGKATPTSVPEGRR